MKYLKTLVFFLIFFFVGAVRLGTAHATFVANDLIDDGVFDNSSSMSAAQIDSWLNSKFPNSCISTNNRFSSPEPTGFNPQDGFTYGTNVSAGTVVYDAAKVYGLNPQVILATLEKESSVVSGNASYRCQYINTAMGYDCPDSGSCPQNPAKESGFSKQIIYATWMLKFHEQRSEGNVDWNVQLTDFPHAGDIWDNSDDPQACYGGRMTQGYRQICPSGASNFYDGYTTIDNTTVHLDTGATAALYDYTPHFHGIQLFVGYFEQWFGSTVGELVRTPDNGQIYITNPDTGYKYPVNSPYVMNDLSTLGIRYVDNSYLSQFAAGQVVSNMIQSPDGTLYLINAGIKLPFSSCTGDVIDYGYTCDSSQFDPLTEGQTNKLVSGPGLTKLIKSNNDGTIYYMSSGKKRPFTSWGDLTKLNIPIAINVFTNSLVNQFPAGTVLYGPGSLVKTSSSGTVYMVKDNITLLPISSFVYPQELGLSGSTRTMSDTDFQSTYNSAQSSPLIKNRITCGGKTYVATKGSLYEASSQMLTNYGFDPSTFVDGGGICSNVSFSSQPLSQYIRISDGTIYYVNGGQKRAFTSYSTYQSPSYCNNSCTLNQVSNFFANSIPSGPNL
jgi:hypothetical protein